MTLSRKQFLAVCAALALPVESVASLIVVNKPLPVSVSESDTFHFGGIHREVLT